MKFIKGTIMSFDREKQEIVPIEEAVLNFRPVYKVTRSKKIREIFEVIYRNGGSILFKSEELELMWSAKSEDK